MDTFMAEPKVRQLFIEGHLKLLAKACNYQFRFFIETRYIAPESIYELISSMDSSLANYYNTFDQAYENLDEGQRKAVDQIEGPVMIISGPGTGKTHMLSVRIAKILQETGAGPHHILCFLLTDAAVNTMHKRLASFIGSDAGKVNLCTFETFCNDVIRENLPVFGNRPMNTISDFEKIRIFKTLIDGLPKNNPLKRYRGDVYFEIRNLQHLFAAMKKEGWSSRFVNGRLDDFIYKQSTAWKEDADVLDDAGPRPGDLEKELEKIEKLRAAANEFDNFQELLYKKNRCESGDKVNWVLEAFEESKNLLSIYQQKFRYILADEYQDITGVQNRLLQMLANNLKKPDLFVAGDDDQGICRYHGTNMQNMLAFADSYSTSMAAMALTVNYRSVPSIINISETLINRNTARFYKQKQASGKTMPLGNDTLNGLVLKEYETRQHEMVETANKIDELLSQGTEPGKMAVIYGDTTYGENLITYFVSRNIPVYSKPTLNILEVPFAKKILGILRYLAAEHEIPYSGDKMLFEILHYDFFQIPAVEIAKITVEANNNRHKGEYISIRQLVQEKVNTVQQTLFDIHIHRSLRDTSNRLEKLIRLASNVEVHVLLENTIDETGLLTYILQSGDKISMQQTLTTLSDFVKAETSRNPDITLCEFMQTIDLMVENNVAVPLLRNPGTDTGVSLLAAHDSKGLEFEYVFVVGCNASLWEGKNKLSSWVRLPDTLFFSLPSSIEEGLRRLFYVALARAQTFLCLSYARFGSDGDEMPASIFIADIQHQHKLPVEKETWHSESANNFDLLRPTLKKQEIGKEEEDLISKLLDKFVMNVTALSNYLNCPLAFYYKNLIRIPQGKSEAAEFGSAVHFAIQRLFERMQTHPTGQFPNKPVMLEDFSDYMHHHRQYFTKEAFNRRLEYGDEILTNYYDKYIKTWNKIVAIERNIANVMVRGIPVKGKLDKLEFNGREVTVVDYKSGDYEKARERLQPPNDKQPHGGDYWRQGVFYKILVDNYAEKNWKVVSTEFDFIEPDKKIEYHKIRVAILPQDVETVTQQITNVWQKIQNRDFYTGCGKANCPWCEIRVWG